jgi:hypothetical protein
MMHDGGGCYSYASLAVLPLCPPVEGLVMRQLLWVFAALLLLAGGVALWSEP